MKRNTLLLFALATLPFALSCERETDVADIQAGSRTFTCVFAEPDTRVSIDNQGKTKWEAGDQILINAGANGHVTRTVTLTAGLISPDGKTATIVVPSDLAPYDRSDKSIVSTYYAMYPASAVASGNLYYNQAFSKPNNKLMAACNVGNTFIFYNLCGILSFTVSGDFDNYVLSGNNGETVSYEVYQARVRDDGSGPYVNYTKDADSYNPLSPLTGLAGTVIADGTTVNYACIPAGANLTKGFTFKFYKGEDLVMTATTDKALNLSPGKMVNLGNISSHLEVYTPPQQSDHKSEIPTGSAVNLAADGSANCYIITKPGTYKFPSLIGNSNDPTANVFGAEILWETYNTNEAVTKNSVIAKVDFEDNWVYFQTPATLKPGNALIAVRDYQDRIIWSWHIWIPATEIASASYGIATAGLELMDRNLGALVVAGSGDIRANGLFYQWGRKDPFIGAGAHGSSDIAKFAGTAKSVSAGPISMAEAIANPTKFGNATGSTSNHDWIVTAQQSETLWDGTKTIYDPCPPGWRVPDNSECIAFSAAANTLDGFTFDNSTNYCTTVGTAVFPLTGYLYYTSGNLDKQDNYAAVWSTHSSNGTSIGLAVWMAVYYDTEKAVVSANTWSERKARGCSVRCILEEAPPFENEPGMPVQGSYTRISFDTSKVVELSGLHLSQDKTFLWGVGDEGVLYKFTNIDGAVSNITPSTVWTYDADMEGVTVDPSTGDLYLAIEPKRVYKVVSPYTSKTTLFDVAEAENMGNSGMEGIAWYKGDLLVGSQSGATLWRYKLNGTKVWKKLLGLYGPITEVGDLFYDAETDLLWVSDSEAHKLFVFDGDVTKLKAMYDVSFIGNAESVCVDHARNCVWVGDDGSTSKIYKISFTGL